jgi:hypothetical protein
MFRVFVSLLTAATVLGHAVVGCCGHHAHADHEHGPAIASHDEADHDHDAHGCSEQAASEPAEHESELPCEGERCSFALAKIIKAGDLDLTPTNSVGLAGQALAPVVVAAPSRSTVTLLDDRPPPLRRHLALGVLLI